MVLDQQRGEVAHLGDRRPLGGDLGGIEDALPGFDRPLDEGGVAIVVLDVAAATRSAVGVEAGSGGEQAEEGDGADADGAVRHDGPPDLGNRCKL